MTKKTKVKPSSGGDGASSAAAPDARAPTSSRRRGRDAPAAAASNMPAPLKGTPAGRGRKAAGAAAGASAIAASASTGSRLEADIAKSLEKAMEELPSFSTMQKATIVQENDKVWYKNISNMCKAMSAKAPSATSSQQRDITIHTKLLNAMVSTAKSYKAWVKKGDDH
eukprot:7051661-Pyramimonas_sp.AAC.1